MLSDLWATSMSPTAGFTTAEPKNTPKKVSQPTRSAPLQGEAGNETTEGFSENGKTLKNGTAVASLGQPRPGHPHMSCSFWAVGK